MLNWVHLAMSAIRTHIYDCEDWSFFLFFRNTLLIKSIGYVLKSCVLGNVYLKKKSWWGSGIFRNRTIFPYLIIVYSFCKAHEIRGRINRKFLPIKLWNMNLPWLRLSGIKIILQITIIVFFLCITYPEYIIKNCNIYSLGSIKVALQMEDSYFTI
jgi:hypothetical protein